MRRIFSVRGFFAPVAIFIGVFLYASGTFAVDSSVVGQVLGKKTEKSETFLTFAKEKDGYTYGGLLSFTAGENPGFFVYGDALGTTEVRLYRTDKESLLEYLRYEKNEDGDVKARSRSVSTEGLEMIAETEKMIRQNERENISFPLNDSGVYYVQAKSGGQLKGEAFLSVSNMGALVREGDDEYIFWAQDAKTGKSLSSGAVTLYSVAEKVRETGSAQLNREGIATIAIGDGDDLAVVESGDDISVIPINLTTVDWASYGLFQKKSPAGSAFTFTDRPLYQPGDTVYFKSILRNDDDARYSIPKGKVRAKAYQGETALYEGELDFSETGTVSGSFQIPRDGHTGWYSLSLEVVSDGGEVLWSPYPGSFDIEEYRKPEYGIDLTLEDDVVVAGEMMTYHVSGLYFSGEPLSGKTVSYRLGASSMYGSAMIPEAGMEEDSSYRYGDWGSQLIEQGEAILDEHGQATIMIQARVPEGSEGKDQVYSFAVEFADGSGEASFERKNAVVYAGDFGIHTSKEVAWSVKHGQEYVLPLQLVAHRDVSTANIALSAVSIVRTYWTEYFIEGRKYPRYESHTESFPDIGVTTGRDGRAEIRFVPEQGGSYALRVEGHDARGNLVMNEFSFWVSEQNGDYFDFSGDETEKLFSLTTDRKKYDPGDQAQVTVSSVLPDRDVFFSVERGRTERYQVIRMIGKSVTFPFPLNGDDMPNVFLSVAGFSQGAFSQKQIGVSVSPEENRIAVSIVKDKESYQPGDDITLSIETKNEKSGRSVSAEVAVYAVDKALFELIDRKPADIFDHFWNERYDDTQGAHSLQGISFYGAEKGGGGGDIRSVFKDTAYWNPTVKTMEDGRASVTFRLPDNLTTWVVFGIANTERTEVGQSHDEIMVSKSVSIRPTVPNMLRVGDTATLSAMVQNATPAEQEFLVSVDFEGGSVLGGFTLADRTQSVTVPRGGTKEVFFGIHADHPSSQSKVRFSVVGRSDEELADAVELSFPIEEAGFFQDRIERIVDGSEFSYDFSPDADMSRSTLSIDISPSIFASVGPLAKSMIDYPYGCVEQTTSRLVPAILAKRGGKFFPQALGGEDIDAVIWAGVERLDELQNDDGGFAWWYGDSDPFVTAYVAEYLLEAKHLERNEGRSARMEGILSQMRAYFDESETALAWPDYGDDSIPVNVKREARDLDVVRLYGRSLFGLKNAHRITDFSDMDPDILSLAVISNVWSGDMNPRTNGVEALISKGVVDPGERMHWSAAPQTRFGSQNVSTAMAIRALVSIPGPRTMAEKGLRYLESEMSPSAWEHTFASAQVLRSIVEFLLSGGNEATSPDYTYEVFANGKSVGRGHIGNIEQLDSLKIPATNLGKSGSVSIQQSGSGAMMLSKKIHEFRRGTMMNPVDHGISIHREYVNIRREGEPLLPGDTVKVRLRVDGIDSERHIVIRDELPGGMVPVQEQFKNAAFDADASGDGWQTNRSVEVVGNGVILSLENFRLQENRDRVFEYMARVVASGEFFAPPAFAALMYAPDVYGYSGGGAMHIDGPQPGTPTTARFLTTGRSIGIIVVSVCALLSIGFAGFRLYRKRKNVFESNDFPTDHQS